MKKLKILLLLSFTALLFNSCRKDNSAPVIPVKITGGTLSVKIKGVVKTSTGPVTATVYEDLGTVQIAGQFSATEGISLMLEDLRVGEFDVASDEVMAIYLAENDGDLSNAYLGISGKVTITSVTDTKVIGTFEFTGENDNDVTEVLSEGSFEASVYKM